MNKETIKYLIFKRSLIKNYLIKQTKLSDRNAYVNKFTN